MLELFHTVYEGGVGEIIEKKSRFIATVMPVSTEDEAIQFIEDMKKKYWDASHNCSAYVIGNNDEIMRCSDDGEPWKTAGRPILDVLLGEGLHNTAIVVTRYFGGTLLGTGGLVRAYQSAAKEGIKQSVIIDKLLGMKLQILTDYNGIGKILYILSQMGITIVSSDYGENITITVITPINLYIELQKKLVEATSGKVQIVELENLYYANISGNILTFEIK